MNGGAGAIQHSAHSRMIGWLALRVVVGLVSTAYAKRRGLSQAEAEAEADRVAASSAGVKPEKVTLEEDAQEKGTAKAVPAPAEKEPAPPAKPEKAGGKTTLAPNPFQ